MLACKQVLVFTLLVLMLLLEAHFLNKMDSNSHFSFKYILCSLKFWINLLEAIEESIKILFQEIAQH